MEFNMCCEIRQMTAISDVVGLCMWNNVTWTPNCEDSGTRVYERTLCCICQSYIITLIMVTECTRTCEQRTTTICTAALHD